jgi:hypothetical protein
MIIIPITAKNRTAGTAAKIAKITESDIPIPYLKFWMSTIL